jgi:hypothetical protein
MATRVGGKSVNHFWTGAEAASIDHFSFFVEGALVAPDISKVDTDRHLNPGTPAWNFRDEVLRRVFHGNKSLSDPKGLLNPFVGTHKTLLLSVFKCVQISDHLPRKRANVDAYTSKLLWPDSASCLSVSFPKGSIGTRKWVFVAFCLLAWPS